MDILVVNTEYVRGTDNHQYLVLADTVTNIQGSLVQVEDFYTYKNLSGTPAQGVTIAFACIVAEAYVIDLLLSGGHIDEDDVWGRDDIGDPTNYHLWLAEQGIVDSPLVESGGS